MHNTINGRSAQIVCILGMHRSGTSVVARILNLLGLYLGPDEHLMHPGEDNPRGYWELSELTAINDQILLLYGGHWDRPPRFPPEWHRSADLEHLRQRATALIRTDFGDSCHWGWKDPRNSLTLPFWQQLVRPTHYVICLRNPLDVIRSLGQRDGLSADQGESLWTLYVANAIAGTAGQRRCFIFFEDVLRDAQAAVRRLAAFLDSPALAQSAGVEERVREFIDPGFVHHSASSMEAFDASLLRSSSKSLYFVLRENVPFYGAESTETEDAEKGEMLPAKLTALAQSILDAERNDRKKSDQIDQLNTRSAQQNNRIRELLAHIRATELDVENLKSSTIALRAQLETMSSGVAVAFLARYRLWVEKLLPMGSRRRQLYHVALKGLGILNAEGLKGICNRILDGRWRAVVARDRTPAPAEAGHPVRSSAAAPSGRMALENKYAVAYGGLVASSSGGVDHRDYVPEAEHNSLAEQAPVRLIAFYLTQFHPIPENDSWWGKGFTDWVNVTRAVPQFVGHYQPHLPDELGFYDLRVPEIQQRQVELAKKYGLYGFCFYYYWFNGKRLLERPLEQFLSNPQIDFPFCLCWANENWTRRWDGREDQILISQEHSAESDFAFIRDVAPLLRNPRYVRINGRPVLVIYRASQLSSPLTTVKRWRQYCREIGVGNPYLMAAQTFGFTDPRRVGFDAAVEFPPHNVHMPLINHSLNVLNPNYHGNIFRYDSVVDQLSRTSGVPYKLYKTVFPGWDNEPRRQAGGSTFAFSTPRAYQEWLVNSACYAMQDPDPETHMVFINAWNEWAEGAHLEPDRRYGYAYLQATADALRQITVREKSVDHDDVADTLRPAQGTKSVSEDTVMIYQMGKVGSKTMEHSLQAAYESLSLQVPIYHVHLLKDIDEIEERVRRERRNPVGTMRALQRGREVGRLLAQASNQHWNFITLVREPVGRNVATLFQNIDEFIPDWHSQYARQPERLLDTLQRILLEAETIHMAPEWWFESQCEPVLGIDVFQEPFPTDAGYRIYENLPRFSLLLVRLESLNKCAAIAIEEFLGIKKFAVETTNVGIRKDYGSVYQAFLDRPLPPEYLKSVYGSKFARHFYTGDEIAMFTRRWIGQRAIAGE